MILCMLGLQLGTREQPIQQVLDHFAVAGLQQTLVGIPAFLCQGKNQPRGYKYQT